MSALQDILASINPSTSTTSSTPTARQTPSTATPKPVQRPPGSVNGALQPPQLKRKASSPADGGQIKIQRKELQGQPSQTNGASRLVPASSTMKLTPSATSTTVPYRGTAGSGASKPANPVVKKLSPAASVTISAQKAAAPTTKVTGNTSTSTASSASVKKPGGYLAMLQKAKEKDQTKPAVPPVKHEPTKILTKKERLALRAEASAAAKGKKVPSSGLAKTPDVKADANKEKRKPAEPGYQGTARPAKKPVDVGYKGTARPTSTATPPARNRTPAAKSKSKVSQGQYGGYASWSDEELDEEEDDYASDASSDMEGGIWDVEQEEMAALKVAKQEDAEALAEENELKRQKEERKRKLMAMNKAAASKRRY